MTTRLIIARNVNHAFIDGWMWLRVGGIYEQTQRGPCVVAPGPVETTYMLPWERVLFNPKRDCNHVFHLMESIWMLAGQRNVSWLLPFNSKFEQYAEPDGNMHGAYGHRWRRFFDVDQIVRVVDALRSNPDTRRAVITMWDPAVDWEQHNDIPCNTTMYFDLRGGSLNMTVCCRSNDILWGAYGANAVHMSFLMEAVARACNRPMGHYRQYSNNFHAYTENEQARHFMSNPPVGDYDKYTDGTVSSMPLMEPGESIEDFLWDCERFVTEDDFRPSNQFLREVARPLQRAFLERKFGSNFWRQQLAGVPADNDWAAGFNEWAQRRADKEEV